MINQMKVEKFKMLRFIPYYFCLAFILYNFIGPLIHGLKPSFYEYWGYSCMHDGYVDSIQDCAMYFLWGMLIAWFVGIDFNRRTIHGTIVTGNNRTKIILCKILASCILIYIFHLLDVIGSCIIFGKHFGFSFDGFGFRDILWLVVVLIQLAAVVSFFVLITFIFKNVYSALFTSVFISAVGGNVLRNFFEGNFIYEHSFFCLAKSSENSDLIPCAICAIIAFVVFFIGTVYIFKKSDVDN